MSVIADARLAFRAVRKHWQFAVVFVLTLGAGLGCVNAMFSVLETVVLRPLPFHDSERIVTVTQAVPFMGAGPQICTLDEFRRGRESGMLDRSAAINTSNLILRGRERAELIPGARVTADFFRVFAIAPVLGRDFTEDDAIPGHNQVTILSHELWRRRFNGDPAIIGRAIPFSGQTMTVIGVAPAGFDFPRLADVAAVMRFAPERTEFRTPLVITDAMTGQNNYSYYVVGRLHAGVATARAAAEFRVSALQSLRYIIERNPQYREPLEQLARVIAVQVTPLRQTMAWGVAKVLWMLFAAVALLLALVVFNLGSLLIARNSNRQHEYAIRQALGGIRGQLCRQTLLEQGMLVALACAVAAMAGWATVEAIRKLGPGRVPRLYELALDPL